MAPLNKIPEELREAFTLNGRVLVVDNYEDATTPEITKMINDNFTKENFEKAKIATRNRQMNYYGMTDIWLYNALEKYSVEGKDVCVIGSTYPWYEAMMITYGANKVDVYEYSDRDVEFEGVRYLKPHEIEKNKYDVCLSISSFEHDGLGRYGDSINPTGDIEAMEKMKTLVKEDGIMLLSVPVGRDMIVFNRHRVYGELRLSMMLEKWDMIDSYGFEWNKMKDYSKGDYQPIFVLKNI